jgi:thiol-disulfide isomerase/thioredoxin
MDKIEHSNTTISSIQMFEIVVYRNQDLYDTQDVSEQTVIERFLYACKSYVDPEYVSEQETDFVNGKMFVSYLDNSGRDKPMIVMLIGLLTQGMIDDIQNGLKKFYNKNCENCDKEIPIQCALCKECINV